MTLRRTISFLIGFAGVVVLIGLDAFRSAGTDFESLARLACLGALRCATPSARSSPGSARR